MKVITHGYVKAPKYGAVVIIDPAGDFVSQVARWKEFVGNKRLIFVRHDLERGMTPTINPFEISGVDPADTSRKARKTKRVVAQELSGALQEVLGGGPGSTFTVHMHALVMTYLYGQCPSETHGCSATPGTTGSTIPGMS